MKKLILTLIFVASSIFASEIEQVNAFEIKLTEDVEYKNILLDHTKTTKIYRSGTLYQATPKYYYPVNDNLKLIGEIFFFENGKVSKGKLQSDYELIEKNASGKEISKLIFIANSDIQFWEDGSIRKGKIAKGSYSLNLEFKDSSGIVELNKEGKISRYRGNTGTYELLGQKLIGTTELVYKTNLTYEIDSASNYIPRILGTVYTGNPLSNIEIIVPSDTKFSKTEFLNSGQVYDYWEVRNNKFKINSWTFGKVNLYIKDMQLYYIQFMNDITIDGISYKTRELVKFNKNDKLEKVQF